MTLSYHQTLIAEIGSVHDGSFGNACKLIEAAAACGADIAKFQTHIAEAETLPDAPSPPYFKGEPRLAYFRRTGFTLEQWRSLKAECVRVGIGFLSSPFSLEAVDLLEEVGVDGYKIPSGEVTNTPLLERVAKTGKPTLLSSGMSNWAELDQAVAALKGCKVTPMQCTSRYPCPPENVGLNVIGEMQKRYGLPVGYSDHADGQAAGIAAVAAGAITVEKHFTFSKLMYGSDAANAMEPADFKSFAQNLKAVWRMLENPVDKNDLTAYRDMKRIFEKSVVTARPVVKGARIQDADLAYKKPGDGIPAAKWRDLIGKTATRDLSADYKLIETDLA